MTALPERRLVSEVFNSAPIIDELLFAGRNRELQAGLDAVKEPGSHLAVFGEIGLGKTSLVNILKHRLTQDAPPFEVRHTNCSRADDFAKVWRRVLIEPLASFEPSTVGDAIAALEQKAPHLFVFDEFGRISQPDSRAPFLFTETIKELSGRQLRSKILVVGAADDVADLLHDHVGVGRALKKISVRRMQCYELKELIEQRLTGLGMTCEEEVLARLIVLSQGFPFFLHVLAGATCLNAIDDVQPRLTDRHLEMTIKKVVGDLDDEIQSGLPYVALRGSPYRLPLAACATARADLLGYVAVEDIYTALKRMSSAGDDQGVMLARLDDLASQRVLVRRHGRYRFADPLLQPKLATYAYSQNLVDKATLVKAQTVDLEKVLGDGEWMAKWLLDQNDLGKPINSNNHFKRLPDVVDEAKSQLNRALALGIAQEGDAPRVRKLDENLTVIKSFADPSVG